MAVTPDNLAPMSLILPWYEINSEQIVMTV